MSTTDKSTSSPGLIVYESVYYLTPNGHSVRLQKLCSLPFQSIIGGPVTCNGFIASGANGKLFPLTLIAKKYEPNLSHLETSYPPALSTKTIYETLQHSREEEILR